MDALSEGRQRDEEARSDCSAYTGPIKERVGRVRGQYRTHHFECKAGVRPILERAFYK